MPDLHWPRVIITALLALALFFGGSYLYRRHFKQENILAELCSLDGVAAAEIVVEKGGEILVITPADSYRGRLENLVAAVEREVSSHYRKHPAIEIKDRRSARLDDFAAAVSPDLYGAARSGCYRTAADGIEKAAAAYGLTEKIFTVDSRYLYLQARDGDSYLYLVVPLPQPSEGGAADA